MAMKRRITLNLVVNGMHVGTLCIMQGTWKAMLAGTLQAPKPLDRIEVTDEDIRAAVERGDVC